MDTYTLERARPVSRETSRGRKNFGAVSSCVASMLLPLAIVGNAINSTYTK
jgi:hypothetical protein